MRKEAGLSVRLSPLLPCWQHFELGLEPKRVSCKLHEVKNFILTFSHSGQVCMVGFCLRDFRMSDSVESWVSFVEVSHRESGASDIMQGVSAHTVWLLQFMDVSLLRIKPSRVGLAWQINFLLAFGNNITSRASLSH